MTQHPIRRSGGDPRPATPADRPSDKRLKRQFGILLLLRTRQWVSAQQLAERYGVSERTIYRDVEHLLRAGIPIRGVPGPEGGYGLDSDGSLDPRVFASEEALKAYLLGTGRTPPAEALWRQLEDAASRLAHELAPEDEALLRATKERLFFDTSDWYWRDDTSNVLPALREAVFSERAVRVSYCAPGTSEPEDLLLLPYGLVWKAGEWYLAAGVVEGDVGRYRVNRIASVGETGLRFERPDKFDLAEWWKQTMHDFGRGDTRVTLRVGPTAREELLRLSLKSDSQVEDLPGGETRITLFVDRWEWLVPLVASYTGDVVVEGPPELRDALVEHFRVGLDALTSSTPRSAWPWHNDDSRLRATRGRTPSL